jgi:uncharacterized protein (AIM24 family)
METIFGDGSEQQSGLFGKLLNAGKRVLTGENLFMTAFINQNNSKEKFLLPPLILDKSFPLT